MLSIFSSSLSYNIHALYKTKEEAKTNENVQIDISKINHFADLVSGKPAWRESSSAILASVITANHHIYPFMIHKGGEVNYLG